MRPTVLEIDSEQIRQNLQLIHSLSKGKRIFAVLKADAYNLGSIEVAKILADCTLENLEEDLDRSVTRFVSKFVPKFVPKEEKLNFAVVLLEEGIKLREHHFKQKILMMAPFQESECEKILEFSITPTIVDYHQAKILDDLAYKKNKRVAVHLKVDSGMGRIGLVIGNSKNEEIFRKIQELKNIHIEGVYSHLSSADIPEERAYTEKQIQIYENFMDRFFSEKERSKENRKENRKEKHAFPIRHIANSAGTLSYPESHMDAVRVGIMLYGVYPNASMIRQKGIASLFRCIELKTRVLFLKKVSKGMSLSYGRTYKAKDSMQIGVLPLGYGDGYSTFLSNQGEVLFRGRRVPIVGRVCMDYTLIDLSSFPDAKLGEEVILIGKDIPVEEIAEKTGQVTYEVLTNLGKRIPRKFKNSSHNSSL